MVERVIAYALLSPLVGTAVYALLILIFGLKEALVVPAVVCVVLLFGVAHTIRCINGRKYDQPS